ncbi:hypothetical protein Tco_1330725, partial [Tanacetum coccineum]
MDAFFEDISANNVPTQTTGPQPSQTTGPNNEFELNNSPEVDADILAYR